MSSRDYRVEFYPSNKIDLEQENLDDFFKFMYERHEIWRRRFIHKLPQEKWTDDLILKSYKYTNVYRELDRGTVWYLDKICNSYCKEHERIILAKFNIKNHNFDLFKKLVWETIIYRLCNRIETFEEVGFPDLNNYDDTILHNPFWMKLETIANRGEAVLTSAHLSCPTPAGRTKVEGYMAAVNDLHQNLDALCRDVINSKTSKEVFDNLCSIYCVGNFIGYEVLCDLIYSSSIGDRTADIPFTLDDWANVGPGATEGIRLIYPSTTGKKNIYARMVQLRDEQEIHLNRLGIKFNFYERFTKGHLSLRTIEHSLCEDSKIWLQRRNLGKQRMILQPNDKLRFRTLEKMFIIDPETGDTGKYLYKDGSIKDD